MSAEDLSSRTIPQLVEQFRVVALAKGDANMGGQVSKYTRLYGKLETLENELQSREGDQRRALVVLYSDPNPQVRLDAAMATLAIFPDQAIAALQMIWDRDEFPQAANAGEVLLDMGDSRFTPG